MSSDFHTRWIIQKMAVLLLLIAQIMANETSILLPILAWLASILLLMQIPYWLTYFKLYKWHVMISIALWTLFLYMSSLYLIYILALFAIFIAYKLNNSRLVFDESDLENSPFKFFLKIKSFSIIFVLLTCIALTFIVIFLL